MPTRRCGTFWRILALTFFLSLGGFGSVILARRASDDRDWAADHARAPDVAFSDSLVRVAQVRNFRYVGADSVVPRWETRTFDLSALDRVWLLLTPFSTAWRGPAHSFVTFGFRDSTFVSVSVEARRERSEEYGILRGLGRNFELIYVVGDEQDLIGRRAARQEGEVLLYPIRATPERIRAVFLDLLQRADRLRAEPEFYNTLANNCTSNLVASVNRVAPGRIPSGLKLLLPGYADEVARSLGLIDPALSIDEARARYRIDDAARAALGREDFSQRIRAGLPAGRPDIQAEHRP
jgi:hypothetical protein